MFPFNEEEWLYFDICNPAKLNKELFFTEIQKKMISVGNFKAIAISRRDLNQHFLYEALTKSELL